MIGLLHSCGTLPNGERWGEDALRWDGSRVRRAFWSALSHPNTWIPAAAAGLFAIDDFDEKVSEWAVEHTPIFGSLTGADDASDYLLYYLTAVSVGTGLATPSGDSASEVIRNKRRGLVGVQILGVGGVTHGLSETLKSTVGRERPDGTDDRSFPSGHTVGAFATAALANRNLEHLDISDSWRSSLQVSNLVLASANGWARIEAERHFPSDILFGAALGHFFAAFINDAFLGGSESSVQLYVQPMPDQETVGITLSFWL